MKNYILLFLLSFVFIRVSAQELSQEISLPRAGDILDKTQLDYTTSGASGGELIWDFRKQTVRDDNYKVSYSGKIDSILCLSESRTQYKYRLSGDSFVANFLFLGGGFLIAFFQFIAYNGFGDIFEYVKPEQLETHVKIDSIKETKTIFYKYVVNQKVYESKQSVYIPSIAECDFYENSVYYNKKIPFLSYVGTKELKLNSPESGMVVFGFFFLFIFLIYRYADMDKWIGVYTRGEYKSSRKK